ncbi:unnamed protein product [Timema podura]|uniref:Uncharacterized protein n=1 Tax=Timema podura TaxID=61482 RepID=A0ABN7NZS5_TIMPD|nr:unnamed protein product [Timema podura]
MTQLSPKERSETSVRMFAAGLLPKVSNLYPPVQYPVSRGTASLSSLVTWNHSETWSSVLDMDLDTVSEYSTANTHLYLDSAILE